MNNLVIWYQAAEDLKAAKAAELALRQQVVAEYFPELVEGEQAVGIEGNAELICTQPYSYSVDIDTYEAALEHLPKTKQEKIIDWIPNLDMSVYNKLTKKAHKAFTAECVTIIIGTPSLEIRPVVIES